MEFVIFFQNVYVFLILPTHFGKHFYYTLATFYYTLANRIFILPHFGNYFTTLWQVT